MSLLGNILGQVAGKVIGNVLNGQNGNANVGGLTQVIGSMLANDGEHGGLGGLIGKFEQSGLGEVIGSWVGKGENMPISADQLSGVLGSNAVSSIAAKLGLNANDAMGQLSQLLPILVDRLTPEGQAPSTGLGNAGDLVGVLAGLLKK